jgi:hypothetical protein
MKEMTTLINVLRTEILKMKRTLSLWLAIIAPLGIAGLEFLVMWAQGEDMIKFANGNIWLWHSKYIQTLWALLLLPLFVTLETALQAGLEHSNRTWKQLFAQPVPRWMILATKQFSGLVLIGISQFLLWGLTIGTGYLLRNVRPDLGFDSPTPWFQILAFNLMTYLMAWLIIAVHSWVALRWGNFVVAMAVGIIATLSGVLLINSDYAPYYPWAMAGLTANNYLDSGIPGGQLSLGILGGVILFVLGNLELRRREVF